MSRNGYYGTVEAETKVVMPSPVSTHHREAYRSTQKGGLAGCPMTSQALLGNGPRIINATLKIHTQLGQGLPELGMVVCGGKSQGAGESPENVARCEVKEVFRASAATAAGVAEGDRILRINNTDVTGMEIEEVVSLLRKAAIDYKWTYSPLRLQLIRQPESTKKTTDMGGPHEDLMTLMTIAIRKNTKMVSSKKPNPIRQTLLQRGFCDSLDQALAANGYYDVTYTL